MPPAPLPLPSWRFLSPSLAAAGPVLVRSDFNAPLEAGASAGAKVSNDARLQAAIPGLAEMAGRGLRLVLLSHLGRGEGGGAPSLAPVAERLRHLLHEAAPELRFSFVPDLTNEAAREAAAGLKAGEILLLENLRRDARETAPPGGGAEGAGRSEGGEEGEGGGQAGLAAALARMGAACINDAFSVSHRRHASVTELPRRLPCFAGPLLLAELRALERCLPGIGATGAGAGTEETEGAASAPASPSAPPPAPPLARGGLALVGGAKVSDKLPLLRSLAGRFEAVAPGGGLANTILAAEGARLGASKREEGMEEACRDLVSTFGRAGTRLLLPLDAKVQAGDGTARTIGRDALFHPGLGAEEAVLDAGPLTLKALGEEAGRAERIVWNGPFGRFETPPFDEGSLHAAALVAAAGQRGIATVAGGGETLAVVARAAEAGLCQMSDFSHLSLGGGAFLAWLEGRELPGLLALRQGPEAGGPEGPEPTRYGDWERKGRAIDF